MFRNLLSTWVKPVNNKSRSRRQSATAFGNALLHPSHLLSRRHHPFWRKHISLERKHSKQASHQFKRSQSPVRKPSMSSASTPSIEFKSSRKRKFSSFLKKRQDSPYPSDSSVSFSFKHHKIPRVTGSHSPN